MSNIAVGSWVLVQTYRNGASLPELGVVVYVGTYEDGSPRIVTTVGEFLQHQILEVR